MPKFISRKTAKEKKRKMKDNLIETDGLYIEEKMKEKHPPVILGTIHNEENDTVSFVTTVVFEGTVIEYQQCLGTTKQRKCPEGYSNYIVVEHDLANKKRKVYECVLYKEEDIIDEEADLCATAQCQCGGQA